MPALPHSARKRLLAWLIAFLLPVMAAAQADQVIKRSLVYLEGTGMSELTGAPVRSIGTGFFITPDGFILTAAHFFEAFRAQKAINIEIKGHVGDPEAPGLTVRYVRALSDTDLILLKARFPDGTATPVAFGKTSTIDPDDGATYRTSGFGQANPQAPVRYSREGGSIITPYDYEVPYAWRFDFSVRGGQSGSPVYTEAGEVIGVVKGHPTGDDSETLVIPIEFATPLIAHLRFEAMESEIAALRTELEALRAEAAKKSEVDTVVARVNTINRFVGDPSPDLPPLTDRVHGVESSMDELARHVIWSAESNEQGALRIAYSKLVSTGPKLEAVSVLIRPKILFRDEFSGTAAPKDGFPLYRGRKDVPLISEDGGRSGQAILADVRDELMQQIELAGNSVQGNRPVQQLIVTLKPLFEGLSEEENAAAPRERFTINYDEFVFNRNTN